uniref:Uncharacterized protein n=1 Tax=Romanomermis culicivorax TaxID=13658 RepID=A0A915KSE5_ROMCU
MSSLVNSPEKGAVDDLESPIFEEKFRISNSGIRLVDHFSTELVYLENANIVATKRVRRPNEFILVLTN